MRVVGVGFEEGEVLVGKFLDVPRELISGPILRSCESGCELCR
jgi:hypothetical protein